MKNWKEIAKEIYNRNVTHKHDDEGRLQAMKEFAKIACEEQKKIIANEVIKIQKPDHRKYVSKKFILNSPTVKFE